MNVKDTGNKTKEMIIINLFTLRKILNLSSPSLMKRILRIIELEMEAMIF